MSRKASPFLSVSLSLLPPRCPLSQRRRSRFSDTFFAWFFPCNAGKFLGRVRFLGERDFTRSVTRRWDCKNPPFPLFLCVENVLHTTRTRQSDFSMISEPEGTAMNVPMINLPIFTFRPKTKWRLPMRRILSDFLLTFPRLVFS